MNRNKNNRNRRNENKKQRKIIRCKVHSRPVFEHEVCEKFCLKIGSNDIKNCLNCKYSF